MNVTEVPEGIYLKKKKNNTNMSAWQTYSGR